MRAPSFKGLREDKSPREVVLEAPDGDLPSAASPSSPEALFDELERLPEGGWRCSPRDAG